MTVVVDTDVFLAALVDDGEHGETAREFLNRDEAFATSTLTMLELQSILVDGAGADPDAVDEARTAIVDAVDVYDPDMDDFAAAFELREGDGATSDELTNNDWTLLALAADVDAELVTFDEAKHEHGAVVPTP